MSLPRIERIEIPTPSSDGPVNVFVLKGDALILIDTGPITRPGLELLKRGLRRMGAQVKNIDAVLLTRAHMDHFGMGSVLADRCNAVMCGHAADRELMEDFPSAWLRRLGLIGSYAEKNGFPAALFRRVSGMDRAALTCARSLTLDVPVQDGQQIDFGNIRLRVMHTPGPSIGSVCYFETRLRTLFSGDVALPRPPPSVYFNGWAPARKGGLGAYLASLHRLTSVAARQICPGHNRAVLRLKSLSTMLERGARVTQRKVLRALRQAPGTAFSISKQIDPAARVGDLWNSFARTLGTLEQLQRRLSVRAEADPEGHLVYALR